MLGSEIKNNIHTLWDYNQLNEQLPDHADVIVVPGCRDLSVVDRAAELYHEGRSDMIVMSGKNGPMTRGDSQTEAMTFAVHATALDVPAAALFLEEESENTGHNILYSSRLLRDLGRRASSVILVQKPYFERRLRATFEQQWEDPETTGYVTSPRTTEGQPMSFDDYTQLRTATERDVAQYVLDTTKRIIEYPVHGFQTEQEMSVEVRTAYDLVTAAFSSVPVDAYSSVA